MSASGRREYEPALAALVAAALAEDVGGGDVTSLAILPPDLRGRGVIRARQPGVLSGMAAAEATFLAVDPQLRFSPQLADGAPLQPGSVIVEVVGVVRSILTAERTALNFLQRLCGVATLTARFVECIRGSGVRILDTRKTTPGMRLLEKEAVRHGGGENHRQGLYDAYLVKDNHVNAAGDLARAIRRLRTAADRKPAGDLPLIVEARTEEEVRVAVAAGVDQILLDNFTPERVAAAVAIVRAAPAGARPVRIEVSGGITLENAAQFALPGVDFLSIGALTHSAPALDLALDLSLAADGDAREERR